MLEENHLFGTKEVFKHSTLAVSSAPPLSQDPRQQDPTLAHSHFRCSGGDPVTGAGSLQRGLGPVERGPGRALLLSFHGVWPQQEASSPRPPAEVPHQNLTSPTPDLGLPGSSPVGNMYTLSVSSPGLWRFVTAAWTDRDSQPTAAVLVLCCLIHRLSESRAPVCRRGEGGPKTLKDF